MILHSTKNTPKPLDPPKKTRKAPNTLHNYSLTTPLIYQLFWCISNNSFQSLGPTGHAVECEHVNLDGVSGPGTCVTAWTFDPITGEEYTKRFCDRGKPSKPSPPGCDENHPLSICFCNTTCCNGEWESRVCSGSDGLLKLSMFAMLLALGINLFFPSKIQ